MDRNNIPGAIQTNPSLLALTEIALDALEGINPSPVMWTLLETYPDAGLYHVASMFDVLGPKGWRLATTPDQRRDLIRNAVRLHKIKGTREAVTEIMRIAGFPNTEVIEATAHNATLPYLYDGVHFYNGQITYGSQWTWWMFAVNIYDDPGNPVITGDLMDKAREMINKYKPVRCVLVDIRYVIRLSDGSDIDDTSLQVNII